MFFPLILHAFDLVISSVAVMVVQIKHNKPISANTSLDSAEAHPGQKTESQVCGGAEDPLATLERGYAIALAQALVLIAILSRWLLYSAKAPDAWWHYMLCGYVGVATSYLFVLFTKYYTDYNYSPVQRIALASRTGPRERECILQTRASRRSGQRRPLAPCGVGRERCRRTASPDHPPIGGSGSCTPNLSGSCRTHLPVHVQYRLDALLRPLVGDQRE
jgi:hypothetical protein